MMRISRRRIGCFFTRGLFTSVLVAVTASCAPAQQITLQRVYDAWRARQDRVKTLQIHWTENHVYFPGSMSFDDDPTGVYPEEETSVEVKGHFHLDGTEKWRAEWVGSEWNNLTGRFEKSQQLQLCDGTTCTSFIGVDGRTFKSHSRGTIAPMVRDPAKRASPSVSPILNTYCPLVRPFGAYADDKQSLIIPESLYNNRVCAVFENLTTRKSRRQTWIALDGDFEIVRWAISLPKLVEQGRDESSGEIIYGEGQERMDTSTVDIECLPHPVAGVELKGWVAIGSTQSAHPKVGHRLDAIVDEFRVNESIDPVVFSFAFPESTEVVDYRVKPPAMHIVRADGKIRLVLPQERYRSAVGYEEYLATETGEAGKPRPSWSLWIYLVALGVAALTAAAWISWSRKQV